MKRERERKEETIVRERGGYKRERERGGGYKREREREEEDTREREEYDTIERGGYTRERQMEIYIVRGRVNKGMIDR